MQKRTVTELTVIASLASTMVFSPLMPAMAVAATADLPVAEAGEGGKIESVDQGTEATEEQVLAADELEAPAETSTAVPSNTAPLADKVENADDTAALRGAGTAEDPYQVASVQDLQLVAEKVNAGDAAYAAAHYKLTANIDLSNVAWTPIGTKDSAFKGTFDGDGKIISNLTINDVQLENAGLFGYMLTPAKLKNVTVSNASVTGKAHVGVIAGSAWLGTVEDCTVTGKITVTGNYKVGGMFGQGYATLTNCSVKADAGSTVTGTWLANNYEGDNVGGLIGFRGEGDIATTNCSVSGVTVAGSRKVGGIVGSAYVDNTYTNCSVSHVSMICNAPYEYAKGVKGQLSVGGLVGMFVKSGNAKGVLSGTVSDVSFNISDAQVAAENWPVMGIVSGGYRPCSFSSSVSAPDSVIDTTGVTVAGKNTGTTAEQKFPGSAAMNGTSSVFSKGAGTQEDPYIIASVDDLKLLATTVNTTGLTYEGQYLKLADSITELDLSAEKWTFIGSSSKKFMGTFDGNGKVITGLNGGSLFGTVSNATFKDLELKDVKVSSASALISSSYDNLSVSGMKVSGSVSSYLYVGGIVGSAKISTQGAKVSIVDCENSATVSSTSGSSKVAGIIGFTDSAKGSIEITNCKNTGSISGAYVAGICGMQSNTTFSSCENTGAITGKLVAGGIVGTANAGTKVLDSTNLGDVTCEAAAGGIIGNSSAGGNMVSKSANTGAVNGVTNAGGIIGGCGSSGDRIDNCYNGGDIAASGDNAIAGGIYGYNNNSFGVKACLNDGVVNADKGSKYQIGKSGYWYDEATGSKNTSCYYIGADGKIYLASANGDDGPIEQKDMTRTALADKLNEAGEIKNFWQAQNGSVQPDSLIPGAYDDKEFLTAQVVDADGNVVEGYASLADAVAAATDGQTVKLMKDVSLKETINITGNKGITLDLNGLTLQNDASITDTVTPLINVGNKETGVDTSSLVLTDTVGSGVVKSACNAAAICVRKGASMTAKNVVIDFADANHANSNLAIQVQGLLTVETGTKITSTEGGISVIGEGAALVVNDGSIEGDFYAVTGNGDLSGTTITVNGGKLSSKEGAGIYHPQGGALTLNGGTITGLNGVQMCAGSLVVPETSTVKVSATGADKRDDKGMGDGVIEDGAAISIVNRDYPGGAPNADIKGGTFESKEGETVLDYAWAEGKASEWAEAGEFVDISGGTFNKPIADDLLADGFGMNKQDENGNYGVHRHAWGTEFESDETGHWHVCSVCGEKDAVVVHEVSDQLINAAEATCGKDGYTGDAVCKDCGFVIKKGEKVPATGEHKFGENWTFEGGTHWHECSVCGAKADEAEHTTSKWTSNASEHWRVCEVCNAAYDEAAHEFGDWRVTKEATETEAGLRERSCKVCGAVETEVTPALGEQQKPDDQKPEDQQPGYQKPGDEKPDGDQPGDQNPGNQEQPNGQEPDSQKPSGQEPGNQKPSDQKQADKPKDESVLPQSGDASILTVAATGLAGALATVTGAIASKRRKTE